MEKRVIFTGESSTMASNQIGQSGGGETTARAKKIMAIFHQLAEVLENTEIITIKEMITKVLAMSKTGNDNGIYEVCLEFLKILEYRNGIPVHLMKQAVRCFLFMRDDPDILGKAVSDSYMEMILKDYPSLAMDMELNDEMLKVYFSLLNEGFEESKHIRLMVVGMFAVGKTTLVKRLCKMDASVPPGSTEGIDIFLKSCEVDENRDWIITHSNDTQPHFQERLQKLITKFPRKPARKLSSELSDTIVEQPSPESVIYSRQEVPVYEQEGRSFGDFKQKISKSMQDDKDNYYGKLKDIVKEPKVIKLRPSVSIWDFAGQSVYYSTHHFFLNARSIYLLVLDLSKSLYDEVKEDDGTDCPDMFGNLILENSMEKFTCLDAFKFWMKSIYVYTQQKMKMGQGPSEGVKYTPTIVLIGTHKDEVKSKNLLKGKSYEHYMDEYFNNALASFMNTPIMDLVHPKRFFVSRDGEDREFLEIREEMYKIASTKPFWREKVPAAFIPLEKIVFEKKTQKQEIMQFGDLVNVNEEADFKLLEKKQIQLFLKFQHAFGNLLYYDIEGFNEMIILTPQWIINVFKLFVTHKQCRNQKRQGWTDFENFAKLSPDLIDTLLHDANMSKHKREIIKYMEYLDIIAKPVVFDSSVPFTSQQTPHKVFTQVCSAETSVEKEDFYIMPCMLRKRPGPGSFKTCFEAREKFPPTLCIYIKKGFLPPFIFHCILASCIKELPIARVKGKYCLFYGIGTFEMSPTRRFTLWSVDNIIHLRVSFISKSENSEDRIACCKSIKEDLEKLIVKVFSIHGGDNQRVDKTELFDYMIKCPHCPSQVPFEKEPEDMCNLLSVRNLDLVQEMTCPFCTELVKAQEVKEYWFSEEEKEYDSCGRETITPKQIELLRKCPSDVVLANLAEEIEDYQNLALKLKIREKELSRVISDHPSPKSNLIYHVLHKWKKKGNCCQILYDAMNEAECDTKLFFQIIGEEEHKDEKKEVEKIKSKITAGEYYSLTEQQIEKLSKCIGEEYWLFCIRLGLDETRMQQIGKDHSGNTASQVHYALREWYNKDRPIREFILAMVRSSCDIPKIIEVFNTHC